MDSKRVTERFSDRAAHYDRARPTYPVEMVRYFAETAGLGPGATVADIGSGTGILSGLFVAEGVRVAGVEPNAAMRAYAEARLGDTGRFESFEGAAEATGLPAGAVDAIAVGQAFHWFDTGAFRTESLRICREPRWALLVWNRRLLDATPFLRAYEAFLREWGTDYSDVSTRYEDAKAMRTYYGGPFSLMEFENRQTFTRENLRDRVLSSSYVPAEDDPRRVPMLTALDRLFDVHADHGTVDFLYTTAAYTGRIRD